MRVNDNPDKRIIDWNGDDVDGIIASDKASSSQKRRGRVICMHGTARKQFTLESKPEQLVFLERP
jgi:hypothetical protein